MSADSLLNKVEFLKQGKKFRVKNTSFFFMLSEPKLGTYKVYHVGDLKSSEYTYFIGHAIISTGSMKIELNVNFLNTKKVSRTLNISDLVFIM